MAAGLPRRRARARAHACGVARSAPGHRRSRGRRCRATKVSKYAGSYAARTIVGQPRSTVDPLAWIRSGSIVIVNTAKGVVGQDTAALLGATLLNLVALGIAEQAALDSRHRRPVTLVVDEFHTMPGVDYDAILSELAKYGASLILATQSLARLEARDREQALRATVFANLDGLFAFHTSAEDARYLVRELGGEVDEQDLVALGEHQCYVRLSAGAEPLPAFWVRLAPPPPSDPDLADRLAAVSARRYGRDRAAVDRDLQAVLARIEKRKALQAESRRGQSGEGQPEQSTPPAPSGPDQARKKVRSKGKRADVDPRQLALSDGHSVSDVTPPREERESA